MHTSHIEEIHMSEQQIESPARPMSRTAISAELRSIQSRLAMLSRAFEATRPSEPKRHAHPPPKPRPTETKISSDLIRSPPAPSAPAAPAPKPKVPFRLGQAAGR